MLPLESIELGVLSREESDVPLAREEVPRGGLQGAPRMSADEMALYVAASGADDAKVRQLLASGPALSLLP